jgi:sugar/nucleoside kinase (ribokinase family)
MTDEYTAIVAGHLCLDVIPDLSTNSAPFEQLLIPGKLIEVGTVQIALGGQVANTGLAMNLLGIPTRLMGKVGADLFGTALRERVSRYGAHLPAGLITDSQTDTSYTLVLNPPGTDRIFLHYPGANDSFGENDIDERQVGRSRLFHLGYPPLLKRMYQNNGEELAAIFRRVKALGVTTSLDMALPDPASAAGQANWPEILQRTLPHVDIFLPSAEETLYMLKHQEYLRYRAATGSGSLLAHFSPALLEELSSSLLAMGAKIVGIKLGSNGFYLHTAGQAQMAKLGKGQPTTPEAWAGRQLWAPAFNSKEVGATGAGDSAVAGFLAAWLRDMSAEATVTMATAVGASNVEAADSLGALRSWEETIQRIKSGWTKRPLTLNSPGWGYNSDKMIWEKRSH